MEEQINEDMDNDVDALWELINSLKAEIAHQKARKNSIGHEVDKWRRRAVASRAEFAKAETIAKTLREDLDFHMKLSGILDSHRVACRKKDCSVCYHYSEAFKK